jgi:hypothetical protein
MEKIRESWEWGDFGKGSGASGVAVPDSRVQEAIKCVENYMF